MSDYKTAKDMPLFADQMRVSSVAAKHIESFAKRTGLNVEFPLGDLIEWVTKRANVSPSSVDRILRKMRKDGELNYIVTNRSRSKYMFTEEQS